MDKEEFQYRDFYEIVRDLLKELIFRKLIERKSVPSGVCYIVNLVP